MKSKLKTTSLAIAAVAVLAASCAASAAPPANLGGTTWTVQVTGTIGIAPIRGWYCPSTGRIHFLHNNLGSGKTVRVFTGNLSDDVVGQPLYMAGTMMVDNAAFGDLGEFNFSAVQ
ncbi:MAG: hypothetical protein ACREA0_11040 [bacterium]